MSGLDAVIFVLLAASFADFCVLFAVLFMWFHGLHVLLGRHLRSHSYFSDLFLVLFGLLKIYLLTRFCWMFGLALAAPAIVLFSSYVLSVASVRLLRLRCFLMYVLFDVLLGGVCLFLYYDVHVFDVLFGARCFARCFAAHCWNLFDVR